MSAKLLQPNTIVRHGVDTELFKPGEKKKIEGVPQNNLIIAVGL